MNNPLRFIDPIGFTCFAPDDPDDPDGAWQNVPDSTDAVGCQKANGTWVEDDSWITVNADGPVEDVVEVPVFTPPDPSPQAIIPSIDPSLQLSLDLAKTGVFAMTKPCTYAVWYGGSVLGGALGLYAAGASTIYEMGYAIGWASGGVATAQMATLAVDKAIDAKKGDTAYQATPLDMSQAFAHTCLGTKHE